MIEDDVPSSRSGASREHAGNSRSLGALLLIFAVSPGLFRLASLARVGIPQFTVAESPGISEALAAVTLGTLQDVGVAALAVVSALLVARSRGRLAGAVTLSLFFAGTHLYYLLDLLLYLSLRVRMSVTFFEFLKFPKPFLDSAWAAGLGPLIAGTALVLGTGVLVAWGGFALLPSVRWPSTRQRWVVVGTWLVTIAGTELLPRTTHYAASNIVFRDLFRGIYDREGRWNEPAARRDADVIAEYLTPQGESFRYLDPEYPLLKHTSGFTGPTHFDVVEPDERPPHIVLLFIESFRAVDVGALGAAHEPSVSPVFDGLAEDGVLYTTFYGNGVQTTRAVIAALFGIPPRFTRRAVQSDDVEYPITGIQDVLAATGYRVAYFHNGPLDFDRQTEFFGAHGFPEIEGGAEMARRHPEATRSSWGVDDPWLMKDMADWLEAREAEGRTGFITAFTISNHHPWQVPDGFVPPDPSVRPEGEYGDFLGTFSYSDAALGHFVDLLSTKNLSERVILVVLGDTGAPMGEHDQNFMPVRHLYEESFRIPLLIWAPGRIEGPIRVDELGSQVDILPTLMDIAGATGLNHGVGTSLRRVAPGRSVYLTNPFHLRLKGAREGRFKYIESQAAERGALYDLVADPGELADVTTSHPAVADELRARVRAVGGLMERLWNERRFTPGPPPG